MSELTTEQLRAALDRLEAEQQRRISEKVERGEAALVPLVVVTEDFEPVETTVNRAKEARLAALRTAGEEREVFFETTIISTGVARPDYSKTKIEDSKEPEQNNLIPGAGDKDKSESGEAIAMTEPRRIWIQVSPASEKDPGAIAEARFTVSGNAVHLEGLDGKPLGSQPLQSGQDAATIARQLLRRKTMPDSFWGPLPEKRWWQ